MAETLRAERASEVADAFHELRWYACYTRARHEKQVERVLAERGFEAFLPLAPRVMQWKDRRKRVEWPLFPSYVFGRFRLAELSRVLETPGLANVVKVDGRPAPIPDAELENVRRLVRALAGGETDVAAERRPYFAAGQWVEVTDGPLAGVRGIVIGESRKRRLLIGLQTIGQGLEVSVDAGTLRAVDGP